LTLLAMADPWLPLGLLHAGVLTLVPVSLGLGWANLAVAGVARPPPPQPDLLAPSTPRGLAERRPPESALHHLLHGLHTGDLDTVLLTVAMAAEENRMPSADPAEERASWPSSPASPSTMPRCRRLRAARALGSDGPLDGTHAEDGARPPAGVRRRR
jgi:hypothetical protein